jgi:hypothetical protein
LSVLLVTLQLYFLHQETAALLTGYAVIYFLTSVWTTDKRAMVLFMLGSFAIFFFRYQSWLDCFILISSILTLLAIYNSNQKRFRELTLAGSLVRIVYYSILFSPVGILLEIILSASNITAYYRFYIRENQ